MLLHELAHAYHDRVLTFQHAGIQEAWREAKKSGIYDSVLRISGTKERHYALTDPQEYFAEGTEAFFGTNDFYPFVRAELQVHDPRLFRLLVEIWN
jgi:dipeptidyl-peptidase-4